MKSSSCSCRKCLDTHLDDTACWCSLQMRTCCSWLKKRYAFMIVILGWVILGWVSSATDSDKGQAHFKFFFHGGDWSPSATQKLPGIQLPAHIIISGIRVQIFFSWWRWAPVPQLITQESPGIPGWHTGQEFKIAFALLQNWKKRMYTATVAWFSWILVLCSVWFFFVHDFCDYRLHFPFGWTLAIKMCWVGDLLFGDPFSLVIWLEGMVGTLMMFICYVFDMMSLMLCLWCYVFDVHR